MTATILFLALTCIVQAVIVNAYQREVERLENVCNSYFDTLQIVAPGSGWPKVHTECNRSYRRTSRRAGLIGFLRGK